LHTNRLDPGEVARREGLPVTSAARTIIDVAASGIAEEQIRKAVHEAVQQGLVGSDNLLSMASRRGGRVLHMIQNILILGA
jgi:hypothetical protein